ncbi:MAG TPA: response regulator [Polyangia bacterium]|nr:response regulator [Polyangia bacterium]
MLPSLRLVPRDATAPAPPNKGDAKGGAENRSATGDPMVSPIANRTVAAAAASVLALTDDAETQDLLMELAVTEGFGVLCAASEAEAANVLHLERPGLVLVDLDMPARTGAKFLRTLRQGPFRDIRSIAITATNDPMLTVSLDAPVFFKPGLEGLAAALERLFWPGPSPAR